jgi:hypothetical protein
MKKTYLHKPLNYMPKFYYYFVVLGLISMVSCKSVHINNESQTTTSENLQLATVGEKKNFVLEQDYNHTAIPNYNVPIKVQVTIEHFNKATYKAFTKANSNQSNSLTINYIDSLNEKPKFVKLEISDRVAVLKALNAKPNTDVRDYLSSKKDAHMITAISLALKKEDITLLIDANEVFLEASGLKSYSLKAYSRNGLTQILEFNQGVVFSYQASNFCWKENSKYQLEIADIVESTDKCPNTSYRSAKRAKTKIDYFKL